MAKKAGEVAVLKKQAESDAGRNVEKNQGASEDDSVASSELVTRYRKKLAEQLGAALSEPVVVSREYREFRNEALPKHLSFYERACKIAGKVLSPKVTGNIAQEMQEHLRIAHLEISASEAYGLSVLFPLVYLIAGALVSFLVFDSLFFVLFFLCSSVGFFFLFQKIPGFIANEWRMRASNQMVLCVFYVVTYMRHTSNLERAITFASEHLTPPLSLDLKKVLWDVETEVYDTVQESLDVYLDSWRKWNNEFVESMHLVEGSLFESEEERRVGLLEKALDVILSETYDRMLHYAQGLKSPITLLHMLGIILPILGLVILPLMVSFMQEVKWYHIAVVYNLVLPPLVYFVGKNILATRPSGYGDVDIRALTPELSNKGSSIGGALRVHPVLIAILVGIVGLSIGLFPVILHAVQPDFEFQFASDFYLLDYKNATFGGGEIGPYGIGASVLSLFIPVGIALALGLYYRLISKDVIGIRERASALEQEFSSALFQLGNRLGDGIPAEVAFDKVAAVMEDSVAGQFFRVVSTNIRKLGMGVYDAIFNPRAGALLKFPSTIIQSSMKVLVESMQKGPRVASQTLLNVSRYIREMHRVDERLRDLMAETISDMQSQVSFLTPVIAAIVIGITSMITDIMGGLRSRVLNFGGEGIEQLSSILSLFGDGIPAYYFQIVVGLYVVQLIFILTVLSHGIRKGPDRLGEADELGKTLIRSTMLYALTALVIMIIFNIIAQKVLTSTLAVAG